MAEPTTPPPPPPVEEPLVTGPHGLALLAYKPAGGEISEDTRFPDAPLIYGEVVLWRGGRLLLVHVRARDCWELPGGGIDPGETPREAAARELREEAGQVIAPADLRFVGFVRTLLPNRSICYGAVYVVELAETAEVQPFEPTPEIGGIHWWDPADPADPPPPGGRLQTVDSYLVELIR